MKWYTAIGTFMMQARQCWRARSSESQSRDSIAEKVAVGVEAQEGLGQVAFGVLGRRGCTLWKGCRGLQSDPTLERGGVQECGPNLHRMPDDGVEPRTQDLDSPWQRAPLGGWEKMPL